MQIPKIIIPARINPLSACPSGRGVDFIPTVRDEIRGVCSLIIFRPKPEAYYAEDNKLLPPLRCGSRQASF
jgi:hypothetical protein